MNFYPESYEEERLKFIRDCIENDTPRLLNETYPNDVEVISNIPYGNGKNSYDIYYPEGFDINGGIEDAFFIIHGGAFVYGIKENNKLFGTHLSRISGFPVVNIDYSLLPDVQLIDVLAEILLAADEVSSKYKIKNLHLTGDSAGGYLSFVSSMIMASDEMKAELNLVKTSDYTLKSVSPLCGCYRTPKDAFPSVYYENEGVNDLPSYMYDIGEAVRRFGAPKTFIITGEEDFLREDNEYLRDVFEDVGLPYTFYMGKNKEDRVMSHIFPIPNPLWPESQEVIEMIISNAKN